jgi:peptidoglycan hydrolase-like protein with peptidoglycan-binding domain
MTTTDPTAPVNPDPELDVGPDSDWGAWPVKGAKDAVQPWEAVAAGDDVPITPRAGLAPLGQCSQGADVLDLAQRLAALGYPSTISKGVNPYNVLDESVIGAVRSFRRDYGVRDDPSGYSRDPDHMADNWIGPWTSEAIRRASDRAD